MFERAIFRSFCRSLRRILFASVLLVFGWIGVAHATATFSITTTNLSAGDTFQFKISAAGTFYVDCGTDGVLTSTANDITGPVNGEYTITRTNATEATYTCTYQSSGGAKIVQFDGAATGYRNDSTAAIRFNIIGTDADTNVKKISSISGSLGQIFGTITNPTTGVGQPKFAYTFYYASNMTGTSIADPNNPNMNYALPPTLFDGIYGSPAESMFGHTFHNCSGLTGSIPSGLFGNLSGSPAQNMFRSTFQSCSGLTGSIPSGLFGNLSGSPAGSMFYATFQSCSGLTGSIPSGLFGNLSGSPAPSMFGYTFSGCSGLTGSIPSGLFGNLSGSPAGTMFRATFSNCRNITGFGDKTYVRWDFLANINTNTSVTEQATNMFYGTQLDIPCPAGTYDVTREQFDDADKPWCKPCPPGTTSPAGSTSVSQCVSSVNLIWETAGGQWPTDPNDNNSSLTNQNSCYWGLDQITPLNQLTRTGYTFAGWKVTNWYHRLLDTLVDSVSSWCYYFRVSATVGGYHAGYNGLCGQLRNSPNNDNTWGLAINNNGVAEKIIGIAKCSDQSTTLYNTGDPGTDNGQYCWCQIISYTSPQGITENYTDLPWVYAYDYTTDTECNANGHCLYECAMTLKSNNTTFRTALFGQTQ